jgi:putative toxin-antitoxin system antitoxin component (TIGR02293 family)
MTPVVARAKPPTRRSPRATPLVAGSVKPTDFVRVYGLAPAERIQLVKRGILASHVVTVARSVGQPKEHLMRVLGLPRATVDRKARAKQSLTVAQGERLLGFAKLVGQVQVMVEQSGDPAGFDAAKWLGEWLERPLPALGGKRPSEYMDTSEGQQLVAGLLAKAQSGAYA